MRLSSALVLTASVPWPTSRRTTIFAHLEVALHYREYVVLRCYVRRRGGCGIVVGWLWVEYVPYLNLFTLAVPMREINHQSASNFSKPDI